MTGTTPQPAPVDAPELQQRIAVEHRWTRVARVGTAAITVGLVANVVLLDLLARDVQARVDHDLDATVGLGSDAARFAVGLGALACYFLVAGGFAGVVAWSYCAARTGIALGRAGRRSLNVGMVSWVVPVINFWWPYEVIVDSIPPADRTRRQVLAWWVTWQVALYVAPLHFLNGLFGWRALDLPLLVAALVVVVAAGLLGWRALGAVTARHTTEAAAQLPNA